MTFAWRGQQAATRTSPARPSLSGLTARRSCPGTAARNMVSVLLSPAGDPRPQDPERAGAAAASATDTNARETRSRELTASAQTAGLTLPIGRSRSQ